MSLKYREQCERKICLDTETTGKNDDGTPGDHRIIEIGCAEIIKYGMLSGSEELFRMLKDQPVRNRYEEIVGRCVSIKRDFVEEDEFHFRHRPVPPICVFRFPQNIF